MLNENKLLEILASVVARFGEHEGVRLPGLLGVLETLHRRFKALLRSPLAALEMLFTSLIAFAFPTDASMLGITSQLWGPTS
jgi:hypothetical protein